MKGEIEYDVQPCSSGLRVITSLIDKDAIIMRGVAYGSDEAKVKIEALKWLFRNMQTKGLITPDELMAILEQIDEDNLQPE